MQNVEEMRGVLVLIRKFQGSINGHHVDIEDEIIALLNSGDLAAQAAAIRFAARLVAMEHHKCVFGSVVSYALTKGLGLSPAASIWTHGVHGHHLYYSLIGRRLSKAAELRVLSTDPTKVAASNRLLSVQVRHNLM